MSFKVGDHVRIKSSVRFYSGKTGVISRIDHSEEKPRYFVHVTSIDLNLAFYEHELILYEVR